MRLRHVLVGIYAVAAAGGSVAWAAVPLKDAASFRKVIAVSRLEIMRLRRINAALEGQKNIFAVRLAKAETRKDAKPVALRAMEQKNAALEASLEADRHEISAVKERMKDLQQQSQRAWRELQAYRIVRAALDTRTRQLAAQIASVERIDGERRQALFKIASMTQERLAFQEENADLKRRINASQDMLRHERAVVYREAGAAYTDAGMLPEAINAYNEALVHEPGDPKGHYALGVLYAANGNVQKSAVHLKQYLLLVPGASNRKEMEYLIKTAFTLKGKQW